MSFLLEKKILSDVKHLFKCDDYHSESIEFNINTDFDKIKLQDNALYYLNFRKIDLSNTALISIFSENNFLASSKEDFEFDPFKYLRIESFRNYITVLTENYGTSFVPYQLSFTKIIPFTKN